VADNGLLSAELRLAGRLDERFFKLLAAVAATGSINRAAKTAGYSYKGAWLLLETAANLAHAPLLTRSIGGRGGGGSQLTATGTSLLEAWAHLQRASQAFLREQESWLSQQPALFGTLRRIAMKTSARNQFVGNIASLTVGPVTTEVRLSLRGGQTLTAALSSRAAQELALHTGQEAMALVKASSVVLVGDFAGFRLSASNQLAGTISRVARGAVSSLVGLTLPGGVVITASLTNDAVEAMDLAVGQPASAVFKASAVMLAVSA
jgi:molybdate transport system regulatory protein